MAKTYSDIKSLWAELCPTQLLKQCLVVDSQQQTLSLFEHDKLVNRYSISTAKNGIGNKDGSYQTPSGFHEVNEKIGSNEPLNMLFKARQPMGEVALVNHPKYIEQDTITTRILWLSGLQEGINLSGNVDTKQRYIYIHGTADEKHLGQAVSHGCIRMKNSDIVELFDIINNEAVIYIS